MRLLVSTAEPISPELLESVTGGLPGDAEVLVIAPASTRSPLRFWVSDVDEAIAHAEQVQAETVERLAEAGVEAAGEAGDSEPPQALEDALATFDADRSRVTTVALRPRAGSRRAAQSRQAKISADGLS